MVQYVDFLRQMEQTLQTFAFVLELVKRDTNLSTILFLLRFFSSSVGNGKEKDFPIVPTPLIAADKSI